MKKNELETKVEKLELKIQQLEYDRKSDEIDFSEPIGIAIIVTILICLIILFSYTCIFSYLLNHNPLTTLITFPGLFVLGYVLVKGGPVLRDNIKRWLE